MHPENGRPSEGLGNEVEGRIPVSILSSNRLLRETIARILIHTREFAVIATEPPKFSLGLDLTGVTPDVWVSDSLQCFIDYAFPRRTDHDNTKPVDVFWWRCKMTQNIS